MASAELSVFPKVLPVFRKRHPRVHVVLQILSPREQFQRLRTGRLQIGVVRLPLTDRTLSILPVFREPLIAVLPESHRLAGQRTVALRALRDDALVMFPRQHAPGYYDFLMRICRQSGVQPKLVHESEKLQTIVSLVAMGRGVSLMPKCVSNLARKGVVCRPLGPRVDTELGLVYDPTNRSDLVQAFLNVARAILLKSDSLGGAPQSWNVVGEKINRRASAGAVAPTRRGSRRDGLARGSSPGPAASPRPGTRATGRAATPAAIDGTRERARPAREPSGAAARSRPRAERAPPRAR
jgi:hypothetical protein